MADVDSSVLEPDAEEVPAVEKEDVGAVSNGGLLDEVIEIPQRHESSIGDIDGLGLDDDDASASGGSSKGSIKLQDFINDTANYTIDEDEGSEGEEESRAGENDEMWDELVMFEIPDDDEDEHEDEEEEDDFDYEAWKDRKKLYHYTKFKQQKLMVTYTQSIEKLKSVRKKNTYLQDRICKHLTEKAKVLKECQDAVKAKRDEAADEQAKRDEAADVQAKRDETTDNVTVESPAVIFEMGKHSNKVKVHRSKLKVQAAEEAARLEQEEKEKASKKHRRKKTCHDEAMMRRKKSIINNRRKTLQQAQEAFSVPFDNSEEPAAEEDQLMLPEFKYEMSDVSLTKMNYGTKLRQEMENVIIEARFPINLQWPLSIRGFKEYFQRKNPYGKVIYTMRLQSQIKHTKKVTRKYKYVLHNYNYQIQQYNVLKEVHHQNMEYLETSKVKWDAIVNDLFSRVVQEIRDYSEIAIDLHGKRIPKSQIDHSCRDLVKQFESFQYSARIFYRVLHNVGIAIRSLNYSEQHGEGVELFEFKHLLRTKETIVAQHTNKQDVLKSVKRKCKRFVDSYKTQLDVKDAAEREVNDKFRLSGEITCLLGPKQDAVKSVEALAKKLLRQADSLRADAGIIPFRHLVVDYENTFVTIGEKRQARRELQMKFNNKVRTIHKIFNNMQVPAGGGGFGRVWNYMIFKNNSCEKY